MSSALPPPGLPGIGTSGHPQQSIADAIRAFGLGEGALGEPPEQGPFVKLLFKRIDTAKKIKNEWEKAFEIDRCHDYVKGFQREAGTEEDGQGKRRYQLNKILSALKAKIPRIFYYHPYIRVTASRGREDTPAQTVSVRAMLLQDTINTIIREPSTRFKAECLQAYKESQYSFGVIETGYSAEWGDNPFAQKPPLVENEDTEKELEDTGHSTEAMPPEPMPSAATRAMGAPESPLAGLAALDTVPHNETFYCKHIPARQFLVSSNDRSATVSMDWVAYWEWMYVEDVKRTPSFENTEDLKATAKSSQVGYDPDLSPSIHEGDEVPPDMVRVWKMWDLREKKRYVLAEGHNAVLKESEFRMLPLHTLRLEVMPGEWYPIPPVYNQLQEQDEFNDSREFLRLERIARRSRYVYDKQAITPEELEKLESDEMGVFVGIDNRNMEPIRPITQPSLSDSAMRTLSLSEQGFTEATGVSEQSRQITPQGEKATATEITAVETKGDIRDSYEQQEVADWSADVSRGLLRVAINQMTLTRWILLNSDPYSQFFVQDAAAISQVYSQITSDELQEADDALRWDMVVDIESMSPVSESQHASKLIQVLNMLASPGVGRLLSFSPQLLKLTLNLLGIRNAADQKAISDALAMRDQMEMMAMGGGAPPGAPGAPKPPGVAPMPGQPAGVPTPSAGMPPLPPSVLQAMGKGGAPPPPVGGQPMGAPGGPR